MLLSVPQVREKRLCTRLLGKPRKSSHYLREKQAGFSFRWFGKKAYFCKRFAWTFHNALYMSRNLFNYQRRHSQVVRIGGLLLGGDNPVRIQSMANTDTNDTEGSVAQALRIIDAGGELVRFTAQGVREAENLRHIHAGVEAALMAQGRPMVPLVADIHFQPVAADTAARYVEKVRINPGNYVDKARKFEQLDYTDEQYAAELQRIRDRFVPFLDICRKHGTAIRIGVNHGSLSDRIMSRYGDTPRGMVESCMEFLRICVEEHFADVVISIKASNTAVMVQTVRLLADTMEQEGMAFPLHLGVTEAGDGEDGRIKSAVGIGALLADGIGDTIRVSLSEAPEAEIPVARQLADYYRLRENHEPINGVVFDEALAPEFCRDTVQVGLVGGNRVPVVFGRRSDYGKLAPDIYLSENGWETADNMPLPVIELLCSELDEKRIAALPRQAVLLLESRHANPVGDFRAAIHRLMAAGCRLPVVAKVCPTDTLAETMQLKTAADMGVLFLDGLINGLYIESAVLPPAVCVETAFSIMQAARKRMSKTEYISCPSCGRTLFDLQATVARVKAATAHLNGLKIGVMGCIVNGPGEMADADYGYVGAGRGRVSLYKNRVCVEKNIPEEEAVNKLVGLIKANGDWHPADGKQ